MPLPNYINHRLNIANVFLTDEIGNKALELTNCTETLQCSSCDPSTNQETEWTNGVLGDGKNWWCYNETTGILHTKRANLPAGSMPALGLYVEFYPVNTPDHRYGPTTGPLILEPFKTGISQPGNDLYYLTKLGRLELIGIPQIFYEPIYCNSNSNQVIPGIFKDSSGNEVTTRSQFESSAYFYDGAEGRLSQIYDREATTTDIVNSITVGATERQFVVNQENLLYTPIFSGHEFQCCLNLGEESTIATQCCSGFAAARSDNDPTSICKLPTFTNLSVYLNRFVSGDGVNEDSSIGLVDDDFNPTTGEPKMRDSTYQKIFAIGEQFCENGTVRIGGSFGEFTGEPNGGNIFDALPSPLNVQTRYGFVDSTFDFDPSFTSPPSERSLVHFNAGFRWNHQIYCSDREAEN